LAHKTALHEYLRLGRLAGLECVLVGVGGVFGGDGRSQDGLAAALLAVLHLGADQR
jgi:drug/metabolite transporter (DMT)-like permease